MNDPGSTAAARVEAQTQPAALNARGLVADVDHFAVHDGPGIRTAVYLKGCGLRCEWCHSPETQLFSPELLYLEQKCTACGLCLAVCPEGALAPLTDGEANCQVKLERARCTQCGACAAVCYPGALRLAGRWMSAAELLAEVEPERPFFAASGGGVTLSGGEATAQPLFARQFLAGCRALGIHTALETNGYAPWTVFAQLLPLVDLFLYDLKHPGAEAHQRLSGVSNALILSNLRQLAAHGARVWVRVPCIPGLNDSAENLAATARLVRAAGLSELRLLPYNATAGAKYAWLGQAYPLEGLQTQSEAALEELAAVCRAQGLSVEIER